MAYQIMTLKGFINEVRMVSQGPHPRKFCFVLGAGASKTSGIKTGEELVEIWERELAERNSRDHEEWKHQLGITEENRGNFYSDYYQRRFPRDNGGRYRDGYNYLEQLMDKARPSGGYVHLALIMANTTNNVVVTTNFDHLVEDSLVQYTQKMPMVIGHEKLAPYATEEITRPTVVKIHRDLLLNPINKPDELNKLHNEWVKVLDNLFSHYHPVFIGYAGNDNSVMDFLCNNVDKFNSDQWAFPYWLIYGDQLPEGKVGQFLEDTNGYLISHRGFDQVMVQLSNALGQRLPSEREYIENTQDQYKKLMESVNRLLEEDTTEEDGQGPNDTNDGPEGPVPPIMGGGIDAEGITDEDEGTLFSQYLAAQAGDEYEKAQEYARYLVEAHPENPSYHYALGVTLHAMKQYKEAAVEKKKAIELEPNGAVYHHSLGITLQKMKRYEEAAAEKRRAVGLEPEDADYHHSLAVTLHGMKRYEEALEERRRAVTLEPENALYHHQLGVTLHDMERYEEAESEKRRAIELEPENAGYHNQLGVTLHAMKRYDEAAEEKRKAIGLEPENAEYHHSLAITLHEIKRYAEAVAEVQKAIELEPENAEYHNGLAITLYEVKWYQEAAVEMRSAIELEPENVEYQKGLAIILRAMGQEEAAE